METSIVKTRSRSILAGANAHARHREKRGQLLQWLLKFHFSNQRILMRLLGLNHRNNYVFFNKLTERGLIRQLVLPSLVRPVIMLTPAGKELAAEKYLDAMFYNTDISSINPRTARHELAVQQAVLNRLSQWKDVTPARLMRNVDTKLPDAILLSAGQRTALEVELTPKTDKRIYIGFAEHARAMLRAPSQYERVTYVFHSHVLKRYYEERFTCDTWPVYRLNRKRKRLEEHEKRFVPQDYEGLVERFSFEAEELPYD